MSLQTCQLDELVFLFLLNSFFSLLIFLNSLSNLLCRTNFWLPNKKENKEKKGERLKLEACAFFSLASCLFGKETLFTS